MLTGKMTLQDKILNGKLEDFDDLALEVYAFQSQYCKVYNQFLKYLDKSDFNPQTIEDIPFLPVEIFKRQIVKSGDWNEEMVFKSSGTTSTERSSHHIRSLEWYKQIAKRCFEFHYGPLEQYKFIALLPDFAERPDSSLVHMVRFFTNSSESTAIRSDYFYNHDAFYKDLISFQEDGKILVVFGLSFAFLDFASRYTINKSNLIVIETGGMKSQRREIDRKSLLESLSKSMPNARIHSEYGMTEMLSQAYALDGEHFKTSPWLRFFISNPADPLELVGFNRRGLINVIDLGNLFTCSFLQTGDIGILDELNGLEIMGRLDTRELRGCIQLYD